MAVRQITAKGSKRVQVTNPDDLIPDHLKIGNEEYFLVSSPEMERYLKGILKNLRAMNLHLSHITNIDIEEADLDG